MNKHNLNKHSFLALAAALMIAPTYVNANTNDNAQKIAVVKKIVNYGDVDGYAKDYKLPRERFYEFALDDFSNNANWVAPLASQGLKASIKKQQKFEQDVDRGVIKNYTEGDYDGTTACEFIAFYLGQDIPSHFPNYQFKVLKNGNVGMVQKGFDPDGKKYSVDSYQIKLVKENGSYKIDDVIPPSYGGYGEDFGPFFKKSYRQRVDHYCRPGKYQY